MADLMAKLAVVGGIATLKSARLDASDFNTAVVAPWVTDRVGTALGSIDDTVSSELQDWLESNLQESVDPTATAAAAREHFADFPATHADRVARTEAAEAYNHGTLSALDLAGVQQVQIHDASDGTDQKTDAPCLSRDGRVVSVKEAKGIGLLHPNCTLYFTPLTTDNLHLERVAEFPAHLNAQGRPVVYDSKAEILYLDESVDEENERQFLKMLGSQLAYR
jgi:hypothetical protein